MNPCKCYACKVDRLRLAADSARELSLARPTKDNRSEARLAADELAFVLAHGPAAGQPVDHNG